MYPSVVVEVLLALVFFSEMGNIIGELFVNLYNFFIYIFGFILFCLGACSYAAQPKSVKHIEDIVSGDRIYGYYVVKCDNGAEVEVSAFDDKKLWCLGKGTKDTCQKKQIKIAKVACKGA